MPRFIYDIPQIQLAIWFAVVSVAVVLIGLIIVKPILRLLIGREPGINESIGYATQGFALFYGLLLGLLVVSAYQNQQTVQQSVQNEAAAISLLYSDMNSYPEPIRSEVKAMLRDYVQYTILKDWPAHRRGEWMNGGSNRADAMRQKLATFAPATVAQEIVHRETIASLQAFAGYRQQRLNGVTTRIPDVLWYAVLVGAVINVVLLLMLKVRVIPHFILGTISAFFLGVVLFVIVSLDDPLRGQSGLPPDAYQLVWDRQMIWDESQ